jgi:small GTP-binding protein
MIVSEINIKLTVMGYWGVGKTSIVNSFVGKDFPQMYIPTIGSNILRKEYKLAENHIRLNIWDIGGQRSFNPLNPVFFSNLDAAFLVFDLTNPKETLLEINQTYLKNLKKNSPDCIIYLIGNKSDLVKPEDSEILLNNIRQYQVDNYPIIFVSAITQDNISGIFSLVICDFLKKLEKETKDNQFQGICSEFLESVNKLDEEITNLIINIDSIDSTTLQNKIIPKIVKKVVKSEYEKAIQLEEISEIRGLKDIGLNLDVIRKNVVDAFHNNLLMISDLISSLKNTPISSLNDVIDQHIQDLTNIQKDFELKVDSILELNSYEEKSKIDINIEEGENHS